LFTGIYAKAMLVFILLFGSLFYFIGCIFYVIHITDIRENENANWQLFLVVLFMCICFVAPVVREYREDMLWQHEKNEHQCRVMEIRSGQSAWICNDGSVRWRTSTPDDQRFLWEKFKADHACRLIESRNEDNNGPAREAWKCDNDVVYVKNKAPDSAFFCPPER